MQSSKTYPPLHLHNILAPHQSSQNIEYIYSIVSDESESRIGITSSSSNIKLYALNHTMTFQESLNGHSDQVHSIAFHSAHTLVSCSEDAHVCLFDVRQKNKIVQKQNLQMGPLYSLDIQQPDNNILAVSGDKSIQLWDLRKFDRPLSSFEDIHTMTIRKLKFYPDNKLYSSSDDGLVHIYNLGALSSVEDPEDCLCGAVNANHGVHQFGLCNSQSNILYTINHAHEMALWNLESMTQIGSSLSRSVLESIHHTIDQNSDDTLMDTEMSDNYLVDACYFAATDSLFAYVGTPSGTVIVCKVVVENGQARYEPIAQLSGGHEDSTVIRGMWASKSGQFDKVITGGEDGRVCVWSTREPAVKPTSPVFDKLRDEQKQHHQHSKNPYGRSSGPYRGNNNRGGRGGGPGRGGRGGGRGRGRGGGYNNRYNNQPSS